MVTFSCDISSILRFVEKSLDARKGWPQSARVGATVLGTSTAANSLGFHVGAMGIAPAPRGALHRLARRSRLSPPPAPSGSWSGSVLRGCPRPLSSGLASLSSTVGVAPRCRCVRRCSTLGACLAPRSLCRSAPFAGWSPDASRALEAARVSPIPRPRPVPPLRPLAPMAPWRLLPPRCPTRPQARHSLIVIVGLPLPFVRAAAKDYQRDMVRDLSTIETSEVACQQ